MKIKIIILIFVLESLNLTKQREWKHPTKSFLGVTRWQDISYLILVKYLAVMEVGMREYPIDATTDRAQFGH